MQDDSGTQLAIELRFRGRLPPSVLALQCGHTAILAGVDLSGSHEQAIQEPGTAGVGSTVPNARWNEVKPHMRPYPQGAM